MRICENCGIEHEVIYGSGRFCSMKCSRGFSTKAKRKEINEKVSKKLKRTQKTLLNCFVCNNTFEHVRKNTMTCSKECLNQIKSSRIKQNKICMAGGYRKGSGRGKGGWYESKIAGLVYLDSTYELNYAIYLDNQNIKWERNTKHFYYTEKNYYIPDFYLIEENLYVETKGFSTEKDKLKWQAVPNLKVLFKKDLQSLGILV